MILSFQMKKTCGPDLAPYYITMANPPLKTGCFYLAGEHESVLIDWTVLKTEALCRYINEKNV